MPHWQHPSIYASRALRTPGPRRPTPVRPAGALFQLALLEYADVPPVPELPTHSQYELHRQAESVRQALADVLRAPQLWDLPEEPIVEIVAASAPRVSLFRRLVAFVRGLAAPQFSERSDAALAW